MIKCLKIAITFILMMSRNVDLYSPLAGIPGIFSVPELGHGQGVRPQPEELAVGLGPVNGREGTQHALLIVLNLCR